MAARPQAKPQTGQLWLSRPPFLLIVLVRAVDPCESRITYEILDRDGTPLTGPVIEPLDSSWWRNFQPLVRRYG